MADGEKKERPKFFKRLGYGFVGGLAGGFIFYVLGSAAANVTGVVPANLGDIGFVIGLACGIGIQWGKSIWE